MIREVTLNNFEENIIQNDKPVVLEFYTPTCSHCKKLFSALDKISNEKGENVFFSKCNIAEEPQLQARYDITSVPTLLFINKGQIKNKLIGEVHPLIIEEEIKKL